jgi:hypothetical protein
MAVNTYRITVDLRNKTAKVVGVIAFREEQIDVSVINIDGADPTQMRLGLVRGSTLYAQVLAFTADGSDAEGALSLNTTPLETFFERLGDQTVREFSLIVWQADDTRLLINDPVEVMNNPYFEGMSNPEPLEDPYMLKSVYDVDRNGIVDYAEALATGTNIDPDNISTAVEVREHLDDMDDPHDSIDDTAYNATSWNDVLNQGASKNAIRDKFVLVDAAHQAHLDDTNDPHDSIDDTAYDPTSWNAVTNIGASKNAIRDKFFINDAAIAQNAQDLTDHENVGTIHFLEGDISHLNIQNIGTNTHAQVDTHLAAAAPHSGHVDTTGNETVAGIKTFSSFGLTPSSAPTTNYQWANKKYVDDAIAGAGGSGLTWEIISSDDTAVSNEGFFIDGSSNTVTLTLPATPSVDDKVGVRVLDTSFTVTIARNGVNIEGFASDLVIDIPNSAFELVYSDATYGWSIVTEIGSSSSGGSGDVVGPAGATDNAIARYDGTTGKLIKDSSVLVTDNDIYSVVPADYFSSSTIVGWSGASGVILYRKLGKQVHIWFTLTGTSNSTGVTFTLPYANQSDIYKDMFVATGYIIDNGVLLTTAGAVNVLNGTSTAICQIDMGNGGWTASGTKKVVGQFTYEID